MCEKIGESSAAVPSSSEETDIIPGYASIEEFTKNGYKTLMEAIKYSNALPSGRDWSFYNTSDSFRKIINDEGNYALQLINQVMRTHEIDSSIKNRILNQKVELIIEANDVILEKVANHLDELNGLRTVAPPPIVLQTVSAQLPVNGSWNKPNATTFSVNSNVGQAGRSINLLTAKNIVRPQKFFKDKIDNRNMIPWYPRITDKPNSLKPLAIFLEECDDKQEYSHPYEFELDRFVPTSQQLSEEEPKPPKPLQDTPLIEIHQPEQLDELVETLRTCKEFAVDLEHHSYRSFMGFTCLLQISTQDKDYLIDTLALRDKLHVLNDVFTKNTIVKIFHGADRDVEWLQRDLSVYVVNMFDTHQAAKALQYEGLSLAFLLNKFCNVQPDKKYQLADWRIRPLPNELKAYAREDTHYLIYIYKMLKNELRRKDNISGNLLRSVIEHSTQICKTRYFKPYFLEDTHLNIYRKCTKMFDNRQMYALEQIALWRDNLAREEDESLGYVLPNHMLVKIAETLPREMQGILACCHPIPPLIRSNLLALHHIVLKAREQPVEKAIMKDTTGLGVLKKVSKVSRDSSLHSVHDLSKTSGFRNDLPTLLGNKELQAEMKRLVDLVESELTLEGSPSLSIFGSSSNTDNVFSERKRFKELRGFPYLSPFERYKLVKPYVIEQDKQEEAEKAKEANEPVPERTTEEKTDEERIASIKDHYIKLSLKFNEELQAQKEQEENENIETQNPLSLFEMGGSRKRKREDESDHFVPTRTAFNNTLHCPTPNVNYSARQFNNRRNKGKKRKFDESQEEQMREGEPQSKSKMKKLRRKEKKLQNGQQRKIWQNRPQGQQNVETAQQVEQPQYHVMQQLQRQQSQAQQHQQQFQPQQHQQQSQAQQHQQQFQAQQHQQQSKKATRRGGPNQQQKKPVRTQRGGFQRFPREQSGPRSSRRNETAPNAEGANDNNFSPYDYGAVDFRQFQGGAGSANTGVQIKHSFKPKNRKNQGKKGARAATFANTKSNRGGR